MKKIEQKEYELIKSVIETKSQLDTASKNFETAEGDLIDYYSYQIKANKAKLDYLIKEIKRKGLVLDTINGLELKLYQNEAI